MLILLATLMTTVSLITSATASAAESDWRWVGFEIVGQKTISRTAVEKLIPIELGSSFSADTKKWQLWCEQIQNSLNLHYSYCSAVRFPDKSSYFIVDIVEKGDENRLAFRAAPTGSLPLANKAILSEYEALQKRTWELFNKGTPPIEVTHKGYLDYEDEICSRHVSQLIKLLPPYRSSLIEVIEKDADPTKRAKAATLLNWSSQSETSIKEVLNFLNDPDTTVRNDIARFMVHNLRYTKDPQLIQSVIKSLAVQLTWPSHADRNKALYALLVIAESNQSEIPLIKDKAGPTIKYLAKTSILSNVKGPAEELLKLISE